MLNDNRIHLLDIHDWIDLIQIMLFPTVKDTINNLMSLQYLSSMKYSFIVVFLNHRGETSFHRILY